MIRKCYEKISAPRDNRVNRKWLLLFSFYRLLLPIVILLTLPFWLRKMMRRNGWGTGLAQRFGFDGIDAEWIQQGRVHVHAVSVGETMIAIKLINSMRDALPESKFVLAVTTATAKQIAVAAKLPDVDVIYAPADVGYCVKLYVQRYQPREIILIEAEAWPELLWQAEKLAIPVGMANARLSLRSELRYRRLRSWLEPWWRGLSWVAVQESMDVERYVAIGVPREIIHHTGSIKFDFPVPGDQVIASEMLELLGILRRERRVLLLASTHAEEEKWLLAGVDRQSWLVVCVPRHVERSDEVRRDLAESGWKWRERSDLTQENRGEDALLVDRTGELPTWTALADVVIVGKSIVASGGQNPCEAIHEAKPVIFGPRMENFEPLASDLVAAGGAVRIETVEQLREILRELLLQPERAALMVKQAQLVLARHRGATLRTIRLTRAAQGQDA